MDPFDLSVDIDFVHGNDHGEDDDDDDDDDSDDDEKPKEKPEMKMKKRKSINNDIEIEDFGLDAHKFENQEEDTTRYVPLEGGLGGLITNLSGVKHIINIFAANSMHFYIRNIFVFQLFRVQTVQILGLSSVRNELSRILICKNISRSLFNVKLLISFKLLIVSCSVGCVEQHIWCESISHMFCEYEIKSKSKC